MKMPVGLFSIVIYLVSLLAFILAAKHFHFAERIFDTGMGAFGALIGLLASGIGKEIDRYTPSSELDAKICNERIKLIVTVFNALAIALMIGALARPVVEMTFNIVTAQNVVVLIIGTICHAGTHHILAKLKDEKKLSEPH